MHPGEDRLLAYMDDELHDGERRIVARHLEACDACAATLEELRGAARLLSTSLEVIERPVPEVDPGELRRRAGVRHLASPRAGTTRVRGDPRSGSSGPEDASRVRATGERPRRSLLAAAVLLLAFTGAAAAIPGSPLRAWLSDSARSIASLFQTDERAGATAPEQEAIDAATRLPSGVAVEPSGGRVWISIRSPSPDALVRIRLVDEPRAVVLAADARYRTGPGRIEVIAAGAGDLRVELPRAATAATVEVDGRVVVEKDGGNLRLLTPADTSGSEIFLRPSG